MKQINLMDITEADCKKLIRAAWQAKNGKTPQNKNIIALEMGSEPEELGWTRISIWCKVYGKEYEIKLSALNLCNDTIVSCVEIEEVW